MPKNSNCQVSLMQLAKVVAMLNGSLSSVIEETKNKLSKIQNIKDHNQV